MSTLSHGQYYVREGDNPRIVAERLFGDKNKATMIANANPGEWSPGDYLIIPGFEGDLVTVRDGEQFPSLARRLLGGPQGMDAIITPFFKWNGGAERKLEPEERVFIVKQRRTSYGY